jgi:serine/threonine protein kinase
MTDSDSAPESVVDGFGNDVTIDAGRSLNKLHRTQDLAGEVYTVTSSLRFIRQIGKGGMGHVYLAELESDGLTDKIAVKFSPHANLKELAEEAQIASGLRSSDYIAKTRSFHVIEGSGAPSGAIIMEYIDGEDLLAISNMHTQLGLRMPQKFVGLIGYLCCEALHYAHGEGAIHRDIKPANIMIDFKSGAPKLIDFGLGVLSKDTPKIIGEFCGTLNYMAPEVLRGQEISTRTDIYSLGMTLDALIRGESFLEKSSGSAKSGSVLDRINAITELQERGYEPLSHLSGVHPTLSQIIERAVSFNPNDRYESAGEMKGDLAGFNYGQGFGPVRDVLIEYLDLIRHEDLPDHLNALKINPEERASADLRKLIGTLKQKNHARDYQVIDGRLLLETLPGKYREVVPGYLAIG